MLCRNHPSVTATGHCSECGKSFCDHCLVLIQGHPYCGNCKQKLVPGGSPPPPSRGGPILGPARTALILAVVGFFCPVLSPFALVKAAAAKRMLQDDPSLDGQGMVTAAQIVAGGALLLWLLFIVSRLIGHG